MLDSDDDSSSVSSSSTMQSDQFSVSGTEELEFKKDSLLDEAVDTLYEKRGSTLEKALASIIEAFNSDLQHQFVEKKFATLLHQCLNSIKKGSNKEISLASHVIGLLALTVGPGDNAREILEESIMPISQASKSGSESSKIASLLECLAIITFVGGIDPEETKKSMQIMWQSVHPKSIAYLSTLLDKDDRSFRIAAGEALAVIFEMGSLEKFVAEAKGSNIGSISEGNKSKEGFLQIQGLRGEILNQVRDLSVEAGGKGSAKKDLNNQRNLFKDVLEFLEDGYCPETSMKIGGDSLQTSTWSQLIQLNFLRHFLGGGFTKHMQFGLLLVKLMLLGAVCLYSIFRLIKLDIFCFTVQENEFIRVVFGFTPKRRNLLGSAHISNGQKRMLKSPNSVISKARTQILNKQRMQSKDRNFGHFAVNAGEDDA
ncbi:activating signal cointegrator 1 complex subunit 2-like isoform X1 [Hibiscus syriacus]|uniref:Activating signal cointegrator 1 complex subunit 2-like isoform X1 n=1 Tax=Hibiscus syriacus TaxID=106335 RepID=A0A6A3A7W7_HIBSY|nr:activating signal cointegrator 1 complex subunit 2-like isoform X1 [Hibiscus syriacus]